MDRNLLNLFFYAWLSFVAAGVFFFILNRNAQLKIKAWLPFLGAAGALMFFWVWLGSRPGLVLYTFGAGILLFVAVIAWNTRFCLQCGATVFSRSGLTPRKACSKCGSTLE
jgi:ribosomal protein S27AE